MISTSWPSTVKSRISRSLEKFAKRPLRRVQTFGWPMPMSAAAAMPLFDQVELMFRRAAD
jgi:hypothetical protein